MLQFLFVWCVTYVSRYLKYIAMYLLFRLYFTYKVTEILKIALKVHLLQENKYFWQVKISSITQHLLCMKVKRDGFSVL